MTDGQLAAFTRQAPEWVTPDHFNIEAHTDIPAVTKDQLRLMMRTLLADRFHLAVHYETRQANTFELTLVTPNKTGPSLRPHPPAEPCSKTFSNHPQDPPQPETIALGFPTVCGGILGLPASAADRYKIGARNVPLALIANSFASWGNLGRPVIDRTSLQGNYDFVLEFTPDPPPTGAPDSGGPSFQQALKQQLGLKLEPKKSPVEILLLDHIDHLTDN